MRIYKLIACAIVLVILVNLVSAFHRVSNANTMLESTQTIVLDAGHGGEDGGAIGVDGVYEKDINLSITLILKEIFEDNGYKVVLTRDNDVDLSDESLGSVAERKKSDMQNRLKIINESNAFLAISIHQNYFEEEKYSGAQVFFANENCSGIAERIQSYLVQFVQPDNNRLSKQVDTKYLLNNSVIDMVIVECGFISNKQETENLKDKDYQSEIAKAIFEAVNSIQ